MILLLLALTSTPHPAVPCWMVKAYIEVYGSAKAHDMGKARGWSDAEMAATRARCRIK